MSDAELEARLADRLWVARRDRLPFARETIPLIAGLDAAYRVQALNAARRERLGGRRSGWKVGFTSEAVRRQLGVSEPMYGMLFDDMEVVDLAAASVDGLISPRIEAEIAFVMGRDAPAEASPEAVIDCISHAHAAVEIVDTVFEDWKLGLDEAVCDNAAAALYALAPHRIALGAFDPASAQMRMRRNGEVCASGRGADCMGDPRRSVQWLATAVGRSGQSLRAGDVVLAGALGPISPVRPGDLFVVEIDDLPALTVRFAA